MEKSWSPFATETQIRKSINSHLFNVSHTVIRFSKRNYLENDSYSLKLTSYLERSNQFNQTNGD